MITVGSAWGQLRQGIVVEGVAKDSESDKADLREGDHLLTWSRGAAKGNIESPFDLWSLELEQEPLGPVTLTGIRDAEKQSWVMQTMKADTNGGTNIKMVSTWGITTRPDLPETLFSINREGEELAKAGKATLAVERWRSAAIACQGKYPSWLAPWFLLRAALLLNEAKQAGQANEVYQQALQLAQSSEPEVVIQLLRVWAGDLYGHRDFDNAQKYYEESLEKSRESNPEGLITAANLSSLGSITYGAMPGQQQPDLEKSAAYLRQAVAIRQKIAPTSLELSADLQGLGYVLRLRGDLIQAEKYERSCLAIMEKVSPDSLDTVRVLYTLGVFAGDRGELDAAEQYYQRSQAIVEKLPLDLASAWNLSGLGSIALARGDLVKAEEYYRKGLAIRKKIAPESIAVARNLGKLAEVASKQGDPSQAEKYGLQALAIVQKQAPNTAYAADIFSTLGTLADDRGDRVKAEDYFREALTIEEKMAPESMDVATNLMNLGWVNEENGELVNAEHFLTRALAIAEKITPQGQLVAEDLNDLGVVARDRGDLVSAKKYFSEARDICEKLMPGSPDHADSLAGLATVLRHEQPAAAAQFFEQALTILEGHAARLMVTEEARSNARAKHLGYYRDYVDLLMEQKQPERAFQVLERSRARIMLETLAAASVDVHKGVDPELLQQERSLQESLASKVNHRIDLLSGEHKSGPLAAINKEIDELQTQYNDVEERIRASSPGYAALTQPQPLTATEVQQQLLDDNTALLEYSLGEQHSYVFLVTHGSLSAYELPKRAEIETTAKRLYQLLRTLHRSHPGTEPGADSRRVGLPREMELTMAAAQLSEMVLGPVALQLQGKRLLVVSDGVLQYVPFGILPVPRVANTSKTREPQRQLPLIVEHEVVNLPSASVLGVLRREAATRKEAAKVVAVLADPVFDSKDERVTGKPAPSKSGSPVESRLSDDEAFDSTERLTRSVADLGFHLGEPHLPRLPFSRREAEAIMAVTPEGEGMKALDFSASRGTAMSPELTHYRIVHFATHGLVDSVHPELSGLVLSLVDEHGAKQNGFLDLHDIYNLDLPVELVVLSACETGLGKEINGEGLIGLTRGFMYAGARRVVASLWNTDDAATADLMAHFYHAMEREKLSPAAALREAQIETWKEKRWADPYYWAGFELQGEWQ